MVRKEDPSHETTSEKCPARSTFILGLENPDLWDLSDLHLVIARLEES